MKIVGFHYISYFIMMFYASYWEFHTDTFTHYLTLGKQGNNLHMVRGNDIAVKTHACLSYPV